MSDASEIAEQAAPVSAGMSRRGMPISLIVIHADARSADVALASYTAADAHSAPHYYIDAAGAIVRLIAEDRAARHSGLARLGSRRRNIDRISIGITLEGSDDTARPRAQNTALRRLVLAIQQRYDMMADAALLRWEAGAAAPLDGVLHPATFPAEPGRPAPALLSAGVAPALLNAEGDPQVAARLWAFLQNEAYRQRGGNFNIGSAFHLHASKNAMGAALAASSSRTQWITVNGQTYNYQHFARDTAFNAGERWGEVQSLSDLIAGGIPAPGSVEFELLKMSYAAAIAGSKTAVSGAVQLQPTWAFHQQASAGRLGPALSAAYRITVDGKQYSMQVFGADTLYTPIGTPESATDWQEVKRLSEAPAGALADALWRESYKYSGAVYDGQSPFQQLAAAQKLGTPMTEVYQANVEGSAVTVQVFALDTLYQFAGGVVKRQSALTPPEQVQKWAPKPVSVAPPSPPPAVKPPPPPAGGFPQPAGDRNSANWPPPSPDLPPLFDTGARQRVFGKFDFAPDPVAGNAERIRILGTWQQENIIPVVIPQLIGRAIRGAPKNGTILFHRVAMKQLLNLWAAWDQAGLLDRIQSFDGAFNARFIRGSKTNL
ncbi:MAG TPA: N-acetylmuramoyl-L-alanine amidase, partial [Roseiflexaceae bacterium]|nr:N-acetylmuramoyl-L-alanine amidase [Roseiflexaceae bacterium]